MASLKFARWRARARPEQLPPPGNWRVAYWRGGRGSGKTWTCAHIFAEMILSDPVPGVWGVVAPTYQDTWSVLIEGPSGLLAALGTTVAEVKQGESPLVEYWHRTWGELRFRNGHVVRAASADDGGLRIQGQNLRSAWADEIGLWDNWETAWSESLSFAVRTGNARIIASGTPKATRKARVLVKLLLDDPTVVKRQLKTVDNAANLSVGFLADVVGRAKGTRLERQELEGELIEDVEGALWKIETIDRHRVRPDEVPDLQRVVVALDPAVTSGPDADLFGIVVAGEANGRGYVLADYSMKGTPNECMSRAVRAYREHQADVIVVEQNQGGDFLPALLRTIDPLVPVKKVVATRGKLVRAEPVSSLYEQGKISHVGSLPDLEDELCGWAPDAHYSPGRLDACVWAITELRGLSVGSWATAYGVRRCDACSKPYLIELHGMRCPSCSYEADAA